MKYRVVFFIQNFSRAGGSERATALIANYLSKAGYEVSILSICGDNTSFFDIDSNIKLFTLIDEADVNNRKDFLKVCRQLIKFYRINKFDICIDVFASLSIYTNMLKKFFLIKNITWEHYNYLNNVGMSKWGRKIAVSHSDHIVTLTETDRKRYLQNNKKLSETRISCIFNPSPFQNAETGVEKDNTILAVGRLVKVKGFDQLLDVWSRICNSHQDWQLQIIGQGEEEGNLINIIKERNIRNVTLLGQKNDVTVFYKSASLLVSTSENEGLPMTMIEAQSFGLPIVSFDYETGPKDIITEGVDGYIISQGPNRNQNMAKCIAELICDKGLIEKMAVAAKESSNRFSMDTIGLKWEKIINELLGD